MTPLLVSAGLLIERLTSPNLDTPTQLHYKIEVIRIPWPRGTKSIIHHHSKYICGIKITSNCIYKIFHCVGHNFDSKSSCLLGDLLCKNRNISENNLFYIKNNKKLSLLLSQWKVRNCKVQSENKIMNDSIIWVNFPVSVGDFVHLHL